MRRAGAAGGVQPCLRGGGAHASQGVGAHRQAAQPREAARELQGLVIAALAQACRVQRHRHQGLWPVLRVQRPVRERGQHGAGGEVAVELEPRQQPVDGKFVAQRALHPLQRRRRQPAQPADGLRPGQGQPAAPARVLVPRQVGAAVRAQVQPVAAEAAADHAGRRQQRAAGGGADCAPLHGLDPRTASPPARVAARTGTRVPSIRCL